MNTTLQQNRLDPSLIDRELLNQLVAAFSRPGHVSVIDSEGQETQLPEPLYQHLMRIVRLMCKGQAVIMLPEDETFTTQAAANFLGMSRQFFVDLLKKNEIPHHRVGSHRRIMIQRTGMCWLAQYTASQNWCGCSGSCIRFKNLRFPLPSNLK